MCKIDGNQKKSKQEIIQCLSEEKRNSILSDRNTQMSSECQDQVTFELLGEFEDLRLNPNLEKNCLDDVKKYCNNIKKGMKSKMETILVVYQPSQKPPKETQNYPLSGRLSTRFLYYSCSILCSR